MELVSMPKRFALCLVFLAFLVSGNLRADVVGLQSRTIASGSSNLITFGGAANQDLVRIYFRTTNTSGAKLTSIAFNGLSLASGSTALTADLVREGYGVVASQQLTYAGNGNLTQMGTVADYLLLTNTYYQLAIRTNSAVAITGITGSGYEVNDFIPTYINNDGSLYSNTNPAAYTVYAAIPEPGTMILTGSALLAGAVGAYIKRRRKNRAHGDDHA